MCKVKPFTSDDISRIIPLIVWKFVGPKFEGHTSNDMARFILAWIYAEARARRAEHVSRWFPQDGELMLADLDSWIDLVKNEVGWPQEYENEQD